MKHVCPFCKGKLEQGTTTFTVDLEFGVVVVRETPALICSLCGADWITDDVAAELEKVVERARKNHLMIEVSHWQHTLATVA